MHAIDSLGLDRKGPPRIHHEDAVCVREVQADAAGAQRQQQDEARLCRRRRRRELGQHGRARLLRHGAVEAQERDAVARQGWLEQVQEGGELREDDGLGAWVGAAQALEVREQGRDLGRRGRVQAAEREPRGRAGRGVAARVQVRVLVPDDLEDVALVEGLAAVEAACRPLAFLLLVLNVLEQTRLAGAVPAARYRLVQHRLLGADWALAAGLGLDLLQHVRAEFVDVLLALFGREALDQVLQIHVVG